MGKQEVIERLNNKLDEVFAFQRSFEPLTGAYMECESKASAYMIAINYVEQLDEPQKPFIPQLVAGWIEKSTDPFTKAEKIAYLIKSKDGDSYYFCDWFVRDGIVTQEQGEELFAWATRQSYETLLSLYNGYEVEEEQKWIVCYSTMYLKSPLETGQIESVEITPKKELAYHFKSYKEAKQQTSLIGGAVEEVEE